MNMSKGSDTVLAFLLGAVAGGAVALLLAPEKGEVTRRKLRDGASDIVGKGKGWVSDTAGDLKGKAGDLADRAKTRVSDVTDSARHQLDAVKGAVNEGKEAYRRELEKS
jgi:gas vesicle protein